MKKNGCPGFLYDEGHLVFKKMGVQVFYEGYVEANKMNDVFIGF
jgi:hypothetical protein